MSTNLKEFQAIFQTSVKTFATATKSEKETKPNIKVNQGTQIV